MTMAQRTASTGTVEDCNESVTSGFHQPAVMFLNGWLDEIAFDPLNARVSSVFVELHEAAVA